MSIKENSRLHIPVLLDASLDVMKPVTGENYLDLTAGYGGHATAFLDITKNYTDSVLVDRDINAIKCLTKFEDLGVEILHADFVSACEKLIYQQKKFDVIIVDLGVSSPQLDKVERGFSFTHDGPLDMRMDQNQEMTAKLFLENVSYEQLVETIVMYGEESLSVAKRYAKAILQNRPYQTTGELAEIIKQNHVGKWQKTHPATRTFQAIRIAINDELGQVEKMLRLVCKLLKKGGRIGVISFHSLEDRLVKKYFAEQAKSGYEAELEILTKKPRMGTEDVYNPRARSAKLRVASKK